MLQNADKKTLGTSYLDENLVFCYERGNYLDKQRLPRLLDRITVKLHIPHMRFHSIRHCYATRLFEKKIDIKTVAKLLGHKNTDITQDIYTHVTSESLDEVIEVIQNLV